MTGDPPRTSVRIDTGITDRPIDPEAAVAAVTDPECGGIGLFLGVVRNHHLGDPVTGLTYEAWTEQAEQELRACAEAVAERHPGVRAVHARHRLGALEVGEVSVVVAASAPHRAEAIAAAAALIEDLKARVPIWKHEHLASGDDRWPGMDTP